jgi:purine nucleosidase
VRKGVIMRRFWIDTDTASDDAVALLMALRDPSVDVLAITVVAGNLPLAQAVQNALYCVEIAGGAPVPVFAGADRPLAEPLQIPLVRKVAAKILVPIRDQPGQ